MARTSVACMTERAISGADQVLGQFEQADRNESTTAASAGCGNSGRPAVPAHRRSARETADQIADITRPRTSVRRYGHVGSGSGCEPADQER